MRTVAALALTLALIGCGSREPSPDYIAEEAAIQAAVNAEIARTDSWSDLGCHLTDARVRFHWARGNWPAARFTTTNETPEGVTNR